MKFKEILNEGKIGKLKFTTWGAYSTKKSDEGIADELMMSVNNAVLDRKVFSKLEDPRISVEGRKEGLQIKYNSSNLTKAVRTAYEKLITKIASKM